MEGPGPGPTELTCWPVLPFQCPPCVHGAQESNVSGLRVCRVRRVGAGGGLEVGLAAS